MENKELRIALFTGNYNYMRDGVALTLNRLVRFLESKNIPVLIFSPTGEEAALEHAGELVSIPSIPMPGRPEYRVTVGFPESAQKRLKAFDPTIVHLATPDLLSFRAMRYAQANNVQIVSSYHTHFTSYLKYYNMELLELLAWKYLQWFYSQCKHIYVPSPSMADQLKSEGIMGDLRIWSRGVETQLFSPQKRDMAWRKENGIEDDEIVVTFVSRLVWEKDLQTVIDTLKKVIDKPKIRVMIVGDGPARKEMQYMLRKAFFTGFLEGENLAQAYASSDVFFFPSDTETFGNVTLEAMASGLPAVVADATGSKSLVESGVNGFLSAPKRTEEFAECIMKIVNDSELRTKMAQVARQKALAYDWNNINEGLLVNYREALLAPLPEFKI